MTLVSEPKEAGELKSLLVMRSHSGTTVAAFKCRPEYRLP